YGSGEALGNVFTAPVTLGGLTAKIGFGVTTAEVGFTQMDGLLGLAFTSLNVINNGNWFDKLGLKGEQNRFGFYLSVSDDGDFGEVALGGQDATKFTGPINWHPLVEQLWWEFDFTATYKVGGIKGSVALTAIADTGTTLIILDSVTANDINAGIGAHFDINQGLYVIDCAKKGTTPNVTLAFGGYEYVLPSSRYIIQDGDACFSGFAPGAGNGVPVILGDVFLRVYYSVYDKEGGGRVGFAEA
ncbi:putative aspartic endopeptidase, partial [Zopfochytrium polystomum]